MMADLGPDEIEGFLFPYSVQEPPPANGMTLCEFWATSLNAEMKRGPPLNESGMRAWLSWINRERGDEHG